MKTQNTSEDCVLKVIENSLKRKNIGYEELSKKLRISKNDFKNVILGKRTLKSCEFIAICLYLGLTLKDFQEC